MMNRHRKGRSVRRASGEELLLMAIMADRPAKRTIDDELDRRAKPHLHDRLATRRSVAEVYPPASAA